MTSPTFLVIAWLFQQQVTHALPVLQHVVDLPQAVHQIRRVLVQLKQQQRMTSQHQIRRVLVQLKQQRMTSQHPIRRVLVQLKHNNA